MKNEAWKIWIDTGGTFTDCIATSPSGKEVKIKVLSSSIIRLKVLAVERTILTISLPFPIEKDTLIGYTVMANNEKSKIVSYDPSTSQIRLTRGFRYSPITHVDVSSPEEVPLFAARLVTQTPLGKPFPPIEMKLGSTRGTNALLERKGGRTAFLVTSGFTDLLRIGNQQRADLFALSIVKELPLYNEVFPVEERITSDGKICRPLRKSEIQDLIAKLKRKKVVSIAVAFLNSYKNPLHEIRVGKMLKQAGFRYVSLSHELSSQPKILPRAETAVVNAYLDPVIDEYLSRIRSGLTSSLLKVMSSAGSLMMASEFRPKDSLLSGPAGGVIGALEKAKQSLAQRIITFDMGGTSTDVSRCDGRPDYRYECTVGALKILSPSLAIETIAAGGGSICYFDGFTLQVGPHSAGAAPGPACYGSGGPLTITDINLLLGRLDPGNFSIPIDIMKSKAAFSRLCSALRRKGKEVVGEDILESFVGIANEKMADAIRKISIQQGHDVREYALLCFGGAGAQHACALASLLQIGRIIVPYDAGLLSAFGIGHAKTEIVKEALILQALKDVAHSLDDLFGQLENEAIEALHRQESVTGMRRTERMIFMRLKGQETSIELPYHSTDDLARGFVDRYRIIYGHYLEQREIEIEFIRVRVGEDDSMQRERTTQPYRYTPSPIRYSRVFSDGAWEQCGVFRWEDLKPGARITGAAVVLSNNSTTFVQRGWSFELDYHNNASLLAIESVHRQVAAQSQAALLTLYTNRFTALVEEMGTLLQRTSFSVNVKERLDFSCALLDESGNLVVNAPHIPVHLGSLGVCVRSVIKALPMSDGDVIITNHPAFGGSHLPDITLIKPIFVNGRLRAFVANRAHHAEIGGKKPGSMPSDASTLEEEGVVIPPSYLVKGGSPRWEHIEQVLAGARFPTRSLQENIADLNAALAALELGKNAFLSLCSKFGDEELTFYMRQLRKHAAQLMSKKILSLSTRYGATERLDDGSVLKVAIRKSSKNRITIDFAGSSGVHPGNLNATTAIVQSVVLYVIRLLVNEPVPMNEGLLDPVTIVIPSGMLNPVFSESPQACPAVVGGNTEVSQRLTDTLLKAFKLAACSQGTMNNFLFGNQTFGYYETICGGVGAGPGFNGADAVHQHMTNTRITDPEIMELRYPVVLEEFAIRKGSGGKGKWDGGNGVVRVFRFTDRVEVNILSQHRLIEPYGVHGGENGKRGEQFLLRNKQRTRLPGIAGLSLEAGDRIIIRTPGGGGWKSP